VVSRSRMAVALAWPPAPHPSAHCGDLRCRSQGPRAGQSLREHLSSGTEGGRAVRAADCQRAPGWRRAACPPRLRRQLPFESCGAHAPWSCLTCCAGLHHRQCRDGQRCAIRRLRASLLRQRTGAGSKLTCERCAPCPCLCTQELLKTELEEKTYDAEVASSWCVAHSS
jgi:hypothetical protein